MKPFLLPLAIVVMGCGGAEEPVAPEGDVAIAVESMSSIRRGANTFTLSTADDATTVYASVWMPAMGHAAPMSPRVVRTDATYRIEDVVFSMPGTWELKVDVTCPTRHGSRAFRFEVP
jgi:hypothetical protein